MSKIVSKFKYGDYCIQSVNKRMQQLLDIYTRIKLRIGSEIQVNYYKYDKKFKSNITLLDICGFLYLFGINEDGKYENIIFFEKDTMIESIMVEGSNIPIYYNSYVSKDIFDNYVIEDEAIVKFNNMMLEVEYNYDAFYETYYKREQLIEKYISKNINFKYEDLFFSDKQKEEFETFFKIIVDELSSYARKKGLDDRIKFISYGKTSLIYEIGDKIIKIGKPRRCNYIPYCEYLLQPIVNRTFSFDGYPIHIEITQKVKTLENTTKNRMYCENKIYEEKLDELREKLLSIGLYCKDLHFCNIGILLSDNKISYDEIDYDVSNEQVSSIENNNNLKILSKGEFVIIDLDDIYIQDIIKYSEYLKSIGYDKDKILDITYKRKSKILKH